MLMLRGSQGCSLRQTSACAAAVIPDEKEGPQNIGSTVLVSHLCTVAASSRTIMVKVLPGVG